MGIKAVFGKLARASPGQTIGGILAAISFRFAALSETVALSMAAALAAIAGVQGSIIRRACPVKPAIVVDAPQLRPTDRYRRLSERRADRFDAESCPAIELYSDRILSLP